MENSTLNLRYDFVSVIELEAQGINLLDGGLNKETLMKPKNVQLFVWAGLLHAHPDLKLEDVRGHLKGRKPKEVFDAVTEAVTRDLADSKAQAAS